MALDNAQDAGNAATNGSAPTNVLEKLCTEGAVRGGGRMVDFSRVDQMLQIVSQAATAGDPYTPRMNDLLEQLRIAAVVSEAAGGLRCSRLDPFREHQSWPSYLMSLEQ